MAAGGASLKWGGFDKALDKFQDALANQKQDLMEACGEALVSGTLKRFEDEEDPQGQKWAPVARSGKILTDTARLRNSIDYAVDGDTVRVGSNVIYALIHQQGGVIKPVKKKTLKFKIGKGKGGKWVSAKQVTIKARPYLGVSKEDWQEIADTIKDFIGGAFAG
jgi:phage virion morphogenesis protein